MSRSDISKWARAFRAYGLNNKSVRRHIRTMKEGS